MFGEAYLTMRPANHKRRILAELARISRPGARLGVHEIAFAPDDIAPETASLVSTALEPAIKANVAPLSITACQQLLDEAGFEPGKVITAPLHLLATGRPVQPDRRHDVRPRHDPSP